ncbi:uncharacterized protein LOC132601584 [Lycium barbarum]|uniref:uncharacterized protein LOC132601584 n=1 Tax=Lycium barbarum TaxID=112863 RepID=UPI00293EF21B|nr:uncharacterized protein LOC132601584 [Lycium barbarum]
MGIVETHGVDYVSVQFHDDAKTWWRAFIDRRLVGAPPLSWTQFHQAFSKKYVLRTLRDAHRDEFLHLRQRGLSVSEYEARYIFLARYAAQIILSEEERAIVDNAVGVESAKARSLGESVLQACSSGPTIPSDYGARQSYGGSYSRKVDYTDPSSSSVSMHQLPALRACYVCGDPSHLMRDCPRGGSSIRGDAQSGRDGSYQTKGGHQSGTGSPQASRGGHGGSLCYSFQSRPEAEASDAVISEWRGTMSPVPKNIIFFVRAKKLVAKGCLAYLAYLRDTSVDSLPLESVPIVSEFAEVFPSDLLGIPLDSDIDFCIYLDSGTRPISIPPYWMAPAELRELKEQLQDLWSKGFIRSSVSP